MSSPKICYIAPFYDGTGYSNAAINTVLCMHKAGINVACRNIKLATQRVDPNPIIKELEKKDINNINICIQHILPTYFVYQAGCKNIGYFYTETSHFRPSNWQYKCNLMDEIWVSNKESVSACRDSGVKVDITQVKIPFDLSSYKKADDKLKLGLGRNTFVFYHIGDFSSKKNVENLIRCYLRTFSKDDDVVLILKTYIEGVTTNESREIILNKINEIKQSLRRYMYDKYPPIILITDYLSPEQMNRLHNTGNCFVTLERGAAWNIPAFEASAMGNWVIANEYGGQTQFIKNSKNGHLIRCKLTPVEGMVRCPYPNLFTCYEEWAEPEYDFFQEAMLETYDSYKINGKYHSNPNPKEILRSFDFSEVGEEFKDLLHA